MCARSLRERCLRKFYLQGSLRKLSALGALCKFLDASSSAQVLCVLCANSVCRFLRAAVSMQIPRRGYLCASVSAQRSSKVSVLKLELQERTSRTAFVLRSCDVRAQAAEASFALLCSQSALCKLLFASCSAQVAPYKLLCASCSVQVDLCKLPYASCSAQVALCKLLCARCSTQAALCKLLCASCSAQVALCK